jgi:hypothetical protein
MAARATEADLRKFEHLHFVLGKSAAEAAAAVGKSSSWGMKTAKRIPVKGMYEQQSNGLDLHGGPKRLDQIRDVDRRALDDFGLFRRRFFGRISLPWAEMAAYDIEQRLNSPVKEYIVLNVAPGVGKTTLLHDIAVWQTVKRRSLRAIWGSSTHTLATKGTRRIKGTLERTSPLRADDEERALELAVDAETTLVEAYGLFAPISGLWRADMLTVWQHGEEVSDDKEATWQAYGQDSGFLGDRVDLIVWDDLVTNKSTNTLQQQETQQIWYNSEAETRLEPGGLLVLCGQRLGQNDLYRYCLDKIAPVMVEAELSDDLMRQFVELEEPKYHHIVFPVHDEDKCEGHGKGTVQKPWPEGCLLEPKRLPYHEIRAKREESEQAFQIIYQQNDLAVDDALVKRIWIDGGYDKHLGITHVGCWDPDRAMGQLPDPDQYPGKLISYASIDSSIEKNWGITWWVYHPQTQRRFLMDLFRGSMVLPELLQQSVGGTFAGLMENWQLQSRRIGAPITQWVIEVNAAHAYIPQQQFVKNWESYHRTHVIPHRTLGGNKNDHNLGIGILGPLYQHGAKRLPGLSKRECLPLIKELLAWPRASTTDVLMSDWFTEFNMKKILAAHQSEPYVRKHDIGNKDRLRLIRR